MQERTRNGARRAAPGVRACRAPAGRSPIPAAAAAGALVLALLPACGPADPAAHAADRDGWRPDLLVLVIDCLRRDRIEPRPDGTVLMPNVRSLAAEGMTFTQAYAQASWTRPSVAAMLTGLYPLEHGIGSWVQHDDGSVSDKALSANVNTLAEVLRAAGYTTGLIAEQFQLSRQFGLDQGFDHYRYRTGKASSVNQKTLEWLAGLERGPFFAYVHYLDLHWPYCAPPLVRGTLDEGKSAIDPCRHWRWLGDSIAKRRIDLSADDRRSFEARYDEEAVDMDARLGDFFAALRAAGRWEDTLIVLTADHGEELFEHGERGHGQSLHDELLSVPLVIKPPARWRAPRGQRTDVLAETRDIPATLVDAARARVEPPFRASLLPWVRGTGAPEGPHPFVVSEAHGQTAVRTRTLKLIVKPLERSEELYDLAADPGERTNVAAARPADLALMRKNLMRWREAVRPVPAAGVDRVDDETVEGLRALGYLR